MIQEHDTRYRTAAFGFEQLLSMVKSRKTVKMSNRLELPSYYQQLFWIILSHQEVKIFLKLFIVTAKQ